jgi:hypothetical protein
MDRKTFLKKKDRELRRLESEYVVCVWTRFHVGCDEIIARINEVKNGARVQSFDSYGINDLHQELETFRKTHSDDPCYNRTTHCYLTCEGIKFEVRGWNFYKGVLYVSAVNWTEFAGTCTITINKDNLRNFVITND